MSHRARTRNLELLGKKAAELAVAQLHRARENRYQSEPAVFNLVSLEAFENSAKPARRGDFFVVSFYPQIPTRSAVFSAPINYF